jgi:ferredoxin-type protein NapH
MKKRQKIRAGILLSTFFLFPALYYYISPYLIIEAASRGIINGSFIIFTLLFVQSLILGRAYCGWLCPTAGCQDTIALVRDRRVTKGNFIKWLLWMPWISVILLAAVKNHGYHKADFLYQTAHGISISDIYSFVTYMFVLLLIVLPAFIIGKRSFCHHLCWMAPFMIIGRKIRNAVQWPSLQLRAEADKCVQCHACTLNCPMSLPVEEMVKSRRMENSECILCGSCVDACNKRAIEYRFRAAP